MAPPSGGFMIVQLIQGLYINTPVKYLKDGRGINGVKLHPGIYPDWPESMPVPKMGAKILDSIPNAELLEQRGTEVFDILSTQTEMIVDRMKQKEPENDGIPVPEPKKTVKSEPKTMASNHFMADGRAADLVKDGVPAKALEQSKRMELAKQLEEAKQPS